MERIEVKYRGLDVALRGDKERFVLPASFRKPVAESSGPHRILCLAHHHKWKCLTAFGLSRADMIDELIAKEVDRQTALGNDFDVDTYIHSLSVFAEVPFDPSGRFVLPEYLADTCGIRNELFFHGATDHFTIWAPEVFYAMDAPAFEGAKAACRFKLAEAHAQKAKKK